jgi:hypothetical protein
MLLLLVLVLRLQYDVREVHALLNLKRIGVMPEQLRFVDDLIQDVRALLMDHCDIVMVHLLAQLVLKSV